MSPTRLAAAGTFALIGGGATLLMVASIFQSCRQGGHPHDMGNEAHSGSSSHSSEQIVEPLAERTVTQAPNAKKLTLSHG